MEEAKSSSTAQQKVITTEKDRIERWRKKQAEIDSKVLFKGIKQVDGKEELRPNFQKKGLSKEKQRELFMATMCAATGSASGGFSRLLFAQTINNLSVYDGAIEEADMANATLEALLALKPQDEIEGMLISRLLVLHDHYMHCMVGAKNSSDTKIIDANVNRSTKLMRLYNESLEALNRYRRKGQQKITVQHVNVSDGGQAIVGNVKTGGGDNAKN